MQVEEGIELKYKEVTAWVLAIPPLVALISSYISFNNLVIFDRDLGARMSLVFMITAMFIFITADRYVRLLISPKVDDRLQIVALYKRALILLALVIPVLGLISTVAVGYPDAPLTALSFTAISLSGIGSAWKRFFDKLTGNIPSTEERIEKKGKAT